MQAPPPAKLAESILDAMSASAFDFRTAGSLARELDVSLEDILITLPSLGGKVRNPISTDPRWAHLYRLTERGLTRREKWWKFRAIAGKTNL